jgi:hypothetical protein
MSTTAYHGNAPLSARFNVLGEPGVEGNTQGGGMRSHVVINNDNRLRDTKHSAYMRDDFLQQHMQLRVKRHVVARL